MAGKSGVAVVTGASRGIGPHIATSLAHAGYDLVLGARSTGELEAVARELGAVAVHGDVTVPEGRQALIAAAEHQFGRVDVLVNNAGGDPQREFEVMSWADNEAIVRLNLLAPMELAHRVLPGMLARGRGHIVNISSIAGHVGFPYTESYAAAKDGLIGFTRVIRNDYRAQGVSASAVILGAIRGAGQGQRTVDAMGTTMPRFGTSPAEAVGRAVVKAIRDDLAEVVVMPGPGRLLKAALDLSPALGAGMNRIAGVDATMRDVIEFRKSRAGG